MSATLPESLERIEVLNHLNEAGLNVAITGLLLIIVIASWFLFKDINTYRKLSQDEDFERIEPPPIDWDKVP